VASVTPNAASKTYGTTDPALTGTLTGFLATDGVTATYSRAAGETVTGGPYSITAVLSPAAVLDNYTITYCTAEFTINKRTLTVTATAASKTYDGTALASVTLSDNRVEGNLLTEAWTSATFSDQNAGSGKTVTITGISISGVDVGCQTAKRMTQLPPHRSLLRSRQDRSQQGTTPLTLRSSTAKKWEFVRCFLRSSSQTETADITTLLSSTMRVGLLVL
ncbi:MAG: hypothetical protein JF584_11140, partial [Acidobacteria bacterium]|nr:hypothetical protein [Acidobacteriota bacterium]